MNEKTPIVVRGDVRDSESLIAKAIRGRPIYQGEGWGVGVALFSQREKGG